MSWRCCNYEEKREADLFRMKRFDELGFVLYYQKYSACNILYRTSTITQEVKRQFYDAETLGDTSM